MYTFGTGAWTEVDDYPYGQSTGMFDHYMIFIPEITSYLVIGGKSGGDEMSQIAGFSNGTWYDAGHLKSARRVCIAHFVCF